MAQHVLGLGAAALVGQQTPLFWCTHTQSAVLVHTHDRCCSSMSSISISCSVERSPLLRAGKPQCCATTLHVHASLGLIWCAGLQAANRREGAAAGQDSWRADQCNGVFFFTKNPVLDQPRYAADTQCGSLQKHAGSAPAAGIFSTDTGQAATHSACLVSSMFSERGSGLQQCRHLTCTLISGSGAIA